MRSFTTPHNVYAATNELEQLQFQRQQTILQEQLAVIDGVRGWYPLAPNPGIAERMNPEVLYARERVYRDWELGEVPYTASYVSPLVLLKNG